MGAGLDEGGRLDTRPRFDGWLAGATPRERAGTLIGGADDLPQHPHELEIERGGDEADGWRDFHGDAMSKCRATPIIGCAGGAGQAGLSGRK